MILFIFNYTTMNKKLIIFAATGLMLAACSNDKVTEVSKSYEAANTISFRTTVNGQTRAAQDANTILATEGATFNVTAFNTGTNTSPYINNITYTRNGSGTFSSTEYYYWPASGNLDFYAYSPIDGASSQVSSSDNWKTFTITPTVDGTSEVAGTHVDFVYASVDNKGRADGANGLPLNFRHTGAKVALKVTHTNSNAAKQIYFKVKAWAVGYLDKSGTFTFVDKTDATNYVNTTGSGLLPVGYWSNNDSWATDKQVYRSTALTSGNEIIVAAVAGTPTSAVTTHTFAEEMILVPQGSITAVSAYEAKTANSKPNGSYVAVQLAIYNKSNDILIQDYTWAMWPVAINWAPGKKYTYNVNLDDGGYFETNLNGSDTDNTNLDPVLAGAIIKFATVTVDEWTTENVNATAVTP